LRCEKGAALHFDDKTWPEKGEPEPGHGDIEITVEPSALEFFSAGR